MADMVTDTAQKITDMTIRGAGRIARAGAAAMRDYARAYPGDELEDFRKGLKESADILIASRPTAVSLWNGVHATLLGVEDADTVDGVRAVVIRNADAFITRSEGAVKAIARIGANRIEDGDVILTHCNSSAAIGAIIEAHRQGKRFRVYATESRPWRQGLLTVRDLSEAGVDVTLIIDSVVNSVMKHVTKVFVGADTITSHGALINKVGTSMVALAAHEARVQLYVCSETYKFSPMTLSGEMVKIEEREVSEIIAPGDLPEGVRVFNPVFDCTPASHIDGIITELGLMAPAAVYGVMVSQLGYSVFGED